MTKEATNTALTDAKKVADVWAQNPQFNMNEVTQDSFKAAMESAQKADDTVETLRGELTVRIDERDAQNAALTELITRALSGIRGFFGPDSPQYERAGGTRKSERKQPTRKTKE